MGRMISPQPAAVASWLRRLTFLVVLIVPSSVALGAAGPATLADDRGDGYHPGRHLEVLEDAGGQLTIDEVSRPPHSAGFVPGRRAVLNPGFTRSAFWLRFTLSNPGPANRQHLLRISSPLIDRVDLYFADHREGWIVQRNGESVPLAARPVLHRLPLFPIDLPPATTRTYYLRYQDRGSVPMDLTLWNPETLHRQQATFRFVLGLYYGAMLIIIVFNLALYLYLGVGSYVAYAVYLAFFVLWQMTYNGLGSEFLWPANPWIADRALALIIPAVGFWALHFARTFLRTGKYVPRFHRLLGLLMTSFVLLMVSALLWPDNGLTVPLAALLEALFAPIVLAAGYMCWQRGYLPARYFLVAWFLLLIGTTILALKSFGLLPSNPLTEYGQQVGSILQVSLFFLALGDQVHMMRLAKEAAEAEARRTGERANQQLEEKVNIRTMALEAARREQEKLSAKLAKYLSPQVYQSIFSGRTEVRVRSGRKKLTVFFSDIAGFTELSDAMEPEALTGLLNEYLNEMAEIALRFGGTIDKFIGDAVMIFFGDPESRGEEQDALSCVEMAIAMRERLRELRSGWRHHLPDHPLRVRMGINTGYCTVGNLGSENRLDYTIIGGQVNMAHRLETAAGPDEILISPTTHALIRDRIACASRGALRLKGFSRPVSAYQVLDFHERLRGADEPWREEGQGFFVHFDFARMTAETRNRAAELMEKALCKLRPEAAPPVDAP